MRFLADVHISRRTVEYLRASGHDVVRVDEVLPANAPDTDILAHARLDRRAVVTQDLDFSALVALGGLTEPSVLSLRLTTARIEVVNDALSRAIPLAEPDLIAGAIVSVHDDRIRVRRLPVE